ncbi:unnamed protein product [Rotaria socialis]|uniref:ANK_REP_REGION domain-containing protein n=3 Tax=Rotaria socialis TaxID=392032 RepID=A0A820D2W7_9BILA|nr:unnamed protein product [Rotaria socialis]
MPTQIFLISPKQTRAYKPLKLSKSDRPTRCADISESTSTTLANEQTISSSGTKLLAMKAMPSVRMSPPQQLHDSCFDWDDENRRFGQISKLLQQIELSGELQGQTLLHLAAKLGHEEIMRTLITETSHMNSLLNTRGQTPLLCAIEAGSTSTATLLMEQDPMSLTSKDNIGSSVFHYATEHCNDIILSRAIALLKRLSSSAARLTALQRLVEKNANGKTPFVIAVEKVDFINADSMKTTIDKDKFDIASYFVADTRRFAAIIRIQIDVNGRAYNVLEYSIALKKTAFLRTFITAEMIPLVPLLLEQCVGEDGVDLSVVDDCLRARPAAHRCMFVRSKRFSTSNWLKQHPLSLTPEVNHAPVYHHDIVKICVDLKFLLFGNFLYLLILLAQISFVCLHTGVALSSSTPPHSYYDVSDITCKQLCEKLIYDQKHSLKSNGLRQFLRALLLICSIIVLLKELLKLVTQREKYLRGFFC